MSLLKYLIESSQGEDQYEKNFSDIDREIFKKIISCDPKSIVQGDEITFIGPNAKQLLIPCYKKGETDFFDNPEKVKAAINTYIQNRGTYPGEFRNLANFPSVKDFLTFVDNPESADIKLDIKVEKDKLTQIYDSYYKNNFSRDEFNKIISIDSETSESSIGDIAKNLLLVKAQKSPEEKKYILDNAADISQYIDEFRSEKAKYPKEKQNPMSFSSIKEFVDFVKAGGGDSQWKIKMSRVQGDDPITHSPLKDNIIHIASSKDYDVFQPKTKYAAAQIANGGWDASNQGGMRWCTSSKSSNFWNEYVPVGASRARNGSKLYNFIYKADPTDKYKNFQLAVTDNHVLETNDSYGGFVNGNDSKPYGLGTGNSDKEFIKFLTSHPDVLRSIKNIKPFSDMPEIQKAIDTLDAINISEINITKMSDIHILLDYSIRDVLKSKIKSVSISGVKKIPAQLFEGFNSITSLKILDTVEDIGSRAFKDCTALHNVNLGDTVKIIGYQAFYNCQSLNTTVRIPDSTVEIRSKAFDETHVKLTISAKKVESGNKIKIDANDMNWYKSHLSYAKE